MTAHKPRQSAGAARGSPVLRARLRSARCHPCPPNRRWRPASNNWVISALWRVADRINIVPVAIRLPLAFSEVTAVSCDEQIIWEHRHGGFVYGAGSGLGSLPVLADRIEFPDLPPQANE